MQNYHSNHKKNLKNRAKNHCYGTILRFSRKDLPSNTATPCGKRVYLNLLSLNGERSKIVQSFLSEQIMELASTARDGVITKPHRIDERGDP
jgi:hypothetical protein